MRLPVVLALFAACGSPKSAPAPTSAPPAAAVPATPAPPPVSAKPRFEGVPDTAAGRELAWVLGVLVDDKGQTTKAEIERRFDPSFLTAVPADQMVTTFAQLAAHMSPLALTGVKGEELKLVASITAGDDKLQILLQLDDKSRKIAGLLVRGDAGDAPRPKTFEQASQLLAELAPKGELLVARLDKGTCKPIHRAGTTQPLAIGSTFKLYVLLALADRVIAGKATWDDKLAVRDDWKSLPSGITQNDAAGTQHTLREWATRMISISDNTATDHLLYTLTRKQVESAMRSTKPKSPKLNQPFFSTRELFWLKLAMNAAELDAYSKLDEGKRRAFLDKDLAAKMPTLDKVGEWKTARRLDLEWFANADDLCRTMSTLQQRSTTPAGKELLPVLSKNPGIELDAKTWQFIGYKGGSEPGVINLTWLLRRADDAWFVVVVTANAPDGVVDDSKVLGVARGVIDLAAQTK